VNDKQAINAARKKPTLLNERMFLRGRRVLWVFMCLLRTRAGREGDDFCVWFVPWASSLFIVPPLVLLTVCRSLKLAARVSARPRLYFGEGYGACRARRITSLRTSPRLFPCPFVIGGGRRRALRACINPSRPLARRRESARRARGSSPTGRASAATR